MKDTFTIKQTLKLSEFSYFVLYMVLRKRMVRGILLFVFIVNLIGIFLNFLPRMKYSSHSIITQIVFIPIPLLIIIILSFLVSGLLFISKPGLFKNVTYTFNHWGMEKRGNDFEFSRPWNKFLKYKETKNLILLYITESDAHVIQKKVFSNSELVYFLLFIASRLPSK